MIKARKLLANCFCQFLIEQWRLQQFSFICNLYVLLAENMNLFSLEKKKKNQSFHDG